MAPKGLPADLKAKLSTELLKAVKTKEFADYAKLQGLEVEALDADAYAAAGPAELAAWQKAVTESGAKVD